ncbi:MAG: magnesium transporter CorA family protein [bacterium]|nr:magnesium transporter CorA family protein [bacterium]
MQSVLTLDQQTLRAGTLDDLKRRACTWVHLEEPTETELLPILSHVGITTELFEELMSKAQRPTLRDVEQFSIIVFRSPLFLPRIGTKPVLFIISKAKNDIITITRHHSTSLERLRNMPHKRLQELFAKGATRLLFASLDEIINSYHFLFEKIDETISQIESDMRKTFVKDTVMDRIYSLKKDLILFHKALIGNREVVTGIERAYAAFLDPSLLTDFRILSGDLVQLIELETTYRDILTSTLELHLTTISNNLNLTMKRLSGWGAIILVPSLIAGIFGMNFELIPTARDPHGFAVAVIIMLTVTASLFWYFQKKDWI